MSLGKSASPKSHASKLFQLALLAAALLVPGSTGCRQQAYTELYVDQLNGENRLLEDRIYEYDAAYRSLETEIELLQQDNDRLRTQINSASPGRRSNNFSAEGVTPQRSVAPKPASPPTTTPRSSIPFKPKPDPASDLDSDLNSGPNFEMVPPPSKPDNQSPRIPDPFQSKKPGSNPKTIESELIPPLIELSMPPSAMNEADSQSFDDSQLLKQYPPRSQVTAASSRRSPEDADNIEQANFVSKLENKTAGPLQSSDAPLAIDAQLPLNFANDTDIDSLRIQTHSVITQDDADQANIANVGNNSLHQSVVEIAFHPAFSHAFDSDKERGDDAIRVVLQPKLADGTIVQTDGDLTVIVVDPNANDGNGNPLRLGRWVYAADQLQQYYDPIGSAKGYRLELGPLSDKAAASQVIVFLRIEYADGRKLVNKLPLSINVDGEADPVWTPRVSK